VRAHDGTTRARCRHVGGLNLTPTFLHPSNLGWTNAGVAISPPAFLQSRAKRATNLQRARVVQARAHLQPRRSVRPTARRTCRRAVQW